jgi:ubiquinone/menaquinone biosynthesis C-methylase UbiE
MSTRANFGIDAPGVIRNFLLLALAALLLAWAAARWLPGARGLPRMGLSFAVVFCAQALLMLWTSLVGKRIAARQLLAQAQLHGGERVLDVGCGRGLLLLGAAQRLPRGRAVGIDLWQLSDLSGNARAATEANARALQVSDRVELVDGDMRALPFADGEFDAVLSSLAVHNVYDREGRELALREIARVTRPGGRVLLQDFRHTADYARALRAAGFEQVERRLVNPLLMFPPTWRVGARKPAAGAAPAA